MTNRYLLISQKDGVLLSQTLDSVIHVLRVFVNELYLDMFLNTRKDKSE